MDAVSTAPDYADIQGLSFEQAMQELETIVRKLESGDATLEQSLEDYARGTALKSHCQKTLDDARLKVEKIMADAQGTITTQPLDA